jgi:hypothetical protein
MKLLSIVAQLQPQTARAFVEVGIDDDPPIFFKGRIMLGKREGGLPDCSGL